MSAPSSSWALVCLGLIPQLRYNVGGQLAQGLSASLLVAAALRGVQGVLWGWGRHSVWWPQTPVLCLPLSS